MLIKDIERELPVKFEGRKKNEEVGIEEYNQIVESCYISHLKYNRNGISQKLKEEYSKLKNRTKRMSKIVNITLIRNAKL